MQQVKSLMLNWSECQEMLDHIMKLTTQEPRLSEHVNFAISLLGAIRSTNTKITEVLSDPAKEEEGRGEAEEERGEAEERGRGEAEERGRGEAAAAATRARDA